MGCSPLSGLDSVSPDFNHGRDAIEAKGFLKHLRFADLLYAELSGIWLNVGNGETASRRSLCW